MVFDGRHRGPPHRRRQATNCTEPLPRQSVNGVTTSVAAQEPSFQAGQHYVTPSPAVRAERLSEVRSRPVRAATCARRRSRPRTRPLPRPESEGAWPDRRQQPEPQLRGMRAARRAAADLIAVPESEWRPAGSTASVSINAGPPAVRGALAAQNFRCGPRRLLDSPTSSAPWRCSR